MLLTEKLILSEIKKLEKEGYTWKPLGGNINNEGIIQMLTDPSVGLTERITNAIDAVLEKFYLSLKSSVKNPNKLANQIKTKLKKDEFQKLINVVIHKSESKKENKSISIEITDKGIGISDNDFENTILRLSGDNKLTKKYLMGNYGQGGSTSIRFNEFTIIYSKNNFQKEVMTILRYNIGSDKMKNGTYEYIVKKDVNGSSQFAHSNVLKEQGTKIINVATYYKNKNPFTKKYEPFKNIYSMLTNRLFCPPLPFTLVDNFKKNTLFIQKKLVIGARKELQKIIKEPKYFDEKVILTKQGSEVILRWWVFMPDQDISFKKTFELCLKNNRSPFNFTMNGQTQGYLGGIFLDEIALSFLKKYFICEIDLTNIKKQERHLIFSSSRENISLDNSFWEELKVKITKYFVSSYKLQSINKEIREKMNVIENDDGSFNKWLHRELKNFISLFSKGYVLSSQEIEQKKHEEKKNNEEKLKFWPSYFNFKGDQPLKFSGNNLRIRYETDGMPYVILKAIEITSMHHSLKLINKKQNGKNGIILFDATKTPINENLIIKFNILQGFFIKDVEVCRISGEPDKKKKPGYPKTKIITIEKEDDPNYERLEFNKEKPCFPEYDKLNNKLTIYINFATYTYIGDYLKRENTRKKIRDHYKKGFSIYIVSQIKKNEEANYKFDENYDYNPIAKSLIWTFNNANSQPKA